MARPSMAALISLVRDLINDPAPSGTTPVFTDDNIERALDIHRWDYRYAPLIPLTTISGGTINYFDWYSGEMYWETDATLYDNSLNVLTPSVSDPLHGRWTFATDQQDGVFVSGKVYDPYGAAADLLEMLATRYAIEFDFDADGASYKRSQKAAAMNTMAEKYRRMQRIVTADQTRNDINHVE